MATISFAGSTKNQITVNIGHNGVGAAGSVDNYKIFSNGSLARTESFSLTPTYSAQRTVTGLSPNTQYYISVYFYRGTTQIGNGAGEYYYTKPLQPPTGVPRITSASGLSGRRITASWTAVSGATGYYVYADGVLKTSTSGTSATFNVNYEWTYYSITVIPYNADGSGSSSSPYSVRSLDETPPSINGIMTISNITESSVRISAEAGYDSGSGIAGYRVFRQLGNGTSNLVHITTIYGTSGSVDITGLAENTTYTFAIRAFDNSANHNQTTDVFRAITTLSATPTAPLVLNRFDGGFVMHWGSVSGATHYQLSYKPSVNSVWQSTTVTGTSTTLTLNQWGLQYDFRVRASKNNQSTWGNYSVITSATTNPRIPTLTGNYSGTNASLTVTVASGSFSVLIVERCLRSNNSLVDSLTTSTNGGSVSWTIANASIGLYYFRAKSRLNINNTPLESLGDSNRVQFDRPQNFAWTNAGLHPTTGAVVTGPTKIQGYGFYATAQEWNSLIASIQEFRIYKFNSLYPFVSSDYAVPNEQLRATQFNNIRNAIATMNSTDIPARKNPGDNITAADFNALVSCLNAIS